MNRQQEKTKVTDLNDEEVEIDLMELLYYYRSHIVILLAGFLTGALIVGLITWFLITPMYTATAKLYMVSASKDSVLDLTDLNIGTSLSSDYQELLKIRPILEGVIEENDLSYDYEELLGMITISTITDTRIITITAESPSPVEAKKIANSLARKAEKEIPKLMDTSKPNIAELAIVPKEKSSPSLSKNTVIGALVGMLLVLGVLTWRFMTDDTLKSAEDVEKAFGIMPLSVIPEGDVEAISDKKEKEIRDKKSKDKKKKNKKSRKGRWEA